MDIYSNSLTNSYIKLVYCFLTIIPCNWLQYRPDYREHSDILEHVTKSEYYNEKQVDILTSKNQALQLLYLKDHVYRTS